MRKKPAFLTICAVMISFAALIFFFAGDAAVFLADRAAGCKVHYEKIRFSCGNIFLEGVNAELPKKDIIVNAEAASIDVNWKEIFAFKKTEVSCSLKGVTVSFGKAVKNGSISSGNLMMLPFDPEMRYAVRFNLYYDGRMLKIYDLYAVSEDVKVRGSYEYFKGKDEIALNINMSFSPKITDPLEPSIKDNILSLDEDGWY
ncbi:MAG: hypothetical protein KKG84_02810, partial [Candidatus Omnitrophica bacterium]|nr:hypothetical protein [Candidatus Omnitrophota bacterium]